VTLDNALKELNVIQSRLFELLDEEGRRALAQAIRDLDDQRPAPAKKKGKKRPEPQWRLEIPPGTPLRFIPTPASQDLRHPLAVDIACAIDRPRDGVTTGEHNIAIRIWTDDVGLYFRDAYDAPALRESVAANGGRRVMMRFHFDHANPNQPGPREHLQIGGTQHGNELCWLPENIRVPRFCHHPLSLLMACEFVVRTFYPDKHRALQNEASWRGAIADAQRCYLPPYYSLLGIPQVDDRAYGESLLGRLWNPSGAR
jgi:hypothetical protein